MKSITQDLRFKEAVIKYSLEYGVTVAAIRYKTTRQWIYYWRKRYDGDIHSLMEYSRRPNNHPSQHSEEELKLIRDMRRRNPDVGLTLFWIKMRERGYTRKISSLYRVMIREGYLISKKKRKKPEKPKPYEKMQRPGQRVQIDVKFVPQACTQAMGPGTQLYQFTAIDEYSRQRYLKGFSDNSSYSAMVFLKEALRFFKFDIECVQTDNGQEFTKKLSSNQDGTKEIKPTLFEELLAARGIIHKRIRPYTPRHNGKVERSHRKDGEWFYEGNQFFSLEDFNNKLRVYNRKSNTYPMRPLDWKSPNEVLDAFFMEEV